MTTTDTQPVLDENKVEEFAGRLFETYTSSMVTLMIDVGHRTGLFDAAAGGPATSAELAERAGLRERYVREWLGALTTAEVFSYDPATRSYRLPAEHACCLSGPGSSNIAPLSLITALLGTHVDDVTEAFRSGGGVPYEKFRPRFTDVMDQVNRGTMDGQLIEGILPLTGDLPARLTEGIRAADVGCGTGHAINLLAEAYPASTFVGYDIAADAIERARSEAERMGLTNASFEVHDAAVLPADPPASSHLENNIGNPLAPFLYSISTLHCMQVSLALDGAGLGTCWGEELARQLLTDAGFEVLSVSDVPDDPLDVVYLCRKIGG